MSIMANIILRHVNESFGAHAPHLNSSVKSYAIGNYIVPGNIPNDRTICIFFLILTF